ncbi:Maltose O-acetyltransferase [Candidatus Burkholderia pumila]|uniref:Maltose O-acetyltransferase n=1 Tax=Candidatus Burkholderia pumila TaxID=1090375 RepID=A0ABR5HP04_9BURK|nr:Maltose O-acetyltransferase [Candidatus Burkholderia pumila]
MSRTEKEKMLAGELYTASAPEIQADQQAAREWMQRFNARMDMPLGERYRPRLDGALAIFFCDYDYNITLDAGMFMNYNCTILDVVSVEIGDMTQIATGAQILTADHPRDPAVRATGLELGRPIRIGRNVWIGAGISSHATFRRARRRWGIRRGWA